jgi:hypothetical protein
MRQGPTEYEGIKEGAAGSGRRNLREVLAEREGLQESGSEKRLKAFEQHLKTSPTRGFLTVLFVIIYGSQFLYLVLGVFGQLDALGPLRIVLWAPQWPLIQLYNAKQFMIQTILTIAVYAVLHNILLALHRSILSKRMLGR